MVEIKDLTDEEFQKNLIRSLAEKGVTTDLALEVIKKRPQSHSAKVLTEVYTGLPTDVVVGEVLKSTKKPK